VKDYSLNRPSEHTIFRVVAWAILLLIKLTNRHSVLDVSRGVQVKYFEEYVCTLKKILRRTTKTGADNGCLPSLWKTHYKTKGTL
jgi:hypothetical protein